MAGADPVHEPYLRAWRERGRQAEAANRRAAAEALPIARLLAARLRREFGARRVVLVGSLARGDFGVGSDIDLAAEGVPADRFFEIGVALERAASPFRVDLIPLESASEAFLALMATEGVELREEDDDHRT